jgi:tRNA modification GTPase
MRFIKKNQRSFLQISVPNKVKKKRLKLRIFENKSVFLMKFDTMHTYTHKEDCIAAIATPPGKASLGIIRVSGKESIGLVNRIFSGRDLTKVKSHTLHYGSIKSVHNEIIDEVLISIFRAPQSYTGENVIEINCHGSMYILNRILQLLADHGIRPAHPGEFTFRAFINGKLDLSQAEAVADVIESETRSSHSFAINQMRGKFSEKIRMLREQLLHLSSLIELELDFGEEDLEFADNKQVLDLLNAIEKEIMQLRSSFKAGNVIRNGVAVVIAGRPNAGKSSLLNTLISDDRAIVSHIPGTTRDIIEDSISIEGIKFRFMDTAGLNTTEDQIELIGIEKTHKKIKEADLLIYVFDITAMEASEVISDLKMLKLKCPYIIAANKTDLIEQAKRNILKKKFLIKEENVTFISSKYGENIIKLKKDILKTLDIENFSGAYSVLVNSRHYRILGRITDCIGDVKKGIKRDLSKDFIMIDIRRILHYLGEITGEVSTEDILKHVFKNFCIGK